METQSPSAYDLCAHFVPGQPRGPSLPAQFLPGHWPPDPLCAQAAAEPGGDSAGHQWAEEEERGASSSSVPRWLQAITKDLRLSVLHFNSINETSCNFLPGEGTFLLRFLTL